jgi:hypothetical protein
MAALTPAPDLVPRVRKGLHDARIHGFKAVPKLHIGHGPSLGGAASLLSRSFARPLKPSSLSILSLSSPSALIASLALSRASVFACSVKLSSRAFSSLRRTARAASASVPTRGTRSTAARARECRPKPAGGGRGSGDRSRGLPGADCGRSVTFRLQMIRGDNFRAAATIYGKNRFLHRQGSRDTVPL